MTNEIRISPLGLGLTYAGCFFGAGYVSGKELYEFFGSFGIKGYLGLVLSIILFFVFGVLLIQNVRKSEKTSFDEVIIIKDTKILRIMLGIMTVFMMFGIFVVMSAGAGALINQIFDIPHFVGCAFFVLITCFIALFGIGGIVKVFSAIIPVLVVTTLFICFFAVKKYGLNFDLPVTNSNPLLMNWWFSALTYVSYNMVTLIGTMIPVGNLVKKKATVFSGIAIGCVAAMSIALGILLAVTSIYGAHEAELPMLEIAFKIGNVFGFVYAVLLLLAMFGTSLSSIVAINVYIQEKIPKSTKHLRILTLITGVLAFAFGLRGFGNLVNTLYPIFGYLGFIILVFLIYNNIILRTKKDRQ